MTRLQDVRYAEALVDAQVVVVAIIRRNLVTDKAFSSHNFVYLP